MRTAASGSLRPGHPQYIMPLPQLGVVHRLLVSAIDLNGERQGYLVVAEAAGRFGELDEVPYVTRLGDDSQRQRWLPGMAAGRLIAAVAMTEPGTGSDLRGIRTTAAPVDGGWDDFDQLTTFCSSSRMSSALAMMPGSASLRRVAGRLPNCDGS
jgi:hypothetical protein